MKKKRLLLLGGLALSVMLFAAGCAVATPPEEVYQPEKEEGSGGFDFPSNAFSADVVLDGFLDDERWSKEDVVALGSWDDTDIDSEEYGAIVTDAGDYAHSKRAITKMFRGTVGFHFGFEVRDSDLAYLSLEDGDPAIWTDNVLLNLCTAIDGGTMPMSDDYYFIVTAFGNYCFRRGANAAGMWGAWSGVLDYEAAIHYGDDGETVEGFGVELVIPYAQIGVDKDAPLGFTLRSCDRVTSLNAMLERSWWYKGAEHHFNTPNTYVIWGADNKLYDYYEYQMPAVTVQGTVLDYISGDPLPNIALGGEIVTDANGAFEIKDVNANEDFVLTASGATLLGEQSFTVSRDAMRVTKGGTVTVAPRFLTIANKVTQRVHGRIESLGEVVGATVKVGTAQTTVQADGTYSLDVEFVSPVMRMEVQAVGSNAAYALEIPVKEAVAGPVERNFELPVMSKMPETFGADGSAAVALGWTRDGLFVRVDGISATNGYGVAFSADGTSGKVVLYHNFGTMCITDFVAQDWAYAPPSSFGVDASKVTDSRGRDIYTFVVPYAVLGIEYGAELKIAPFEYTLSGPFAWYEDEDGSAYPFGNLETLARYPVLSSDGAITFAPKEVVLSRLSIGTFGQTNATALFEKVDGPTAGIRVTITYTPNEGFWGFGVMIGDYTLNAGITQLYVPSFGTIDHRVYGDWIWSGNYLFPSALGVEATQTVNDEGKSVSTLFYSYATLQRSDYGLSITADTEEIALQLFEYVNVGGELYGVYNCIRDKDGVMKPFDGGLDGFVRWNTSETTSAFSMELPKRKGEIV